MQKVILVDDMQEGMILAQPLKNRFGQVLLGADVKLENKHKMLFKTWGVESISIKTAGGTGEGNISDELRKEAEEILRKRVNWIPKSPNEEDLINVGLEQIIDKLIK